MPAVFGSSGWWAQLHPTHMCPKPRGSPNYGHKFDKKKRNMEKNLQKHGKRITQKTYDFIKMKNREKMTPSRKFIDMTFGRFD